MFHVTKRGDESREQRIRGPQLRRLWRRRCCYCVDRVEDYMERDVVRAKFEGSTSTRYWRTKGYRHFATPGTELSW